MSKRLRAALSFSAVAGTTGLSVLFYDLSQPYRDRQKEQILFFCLLFGAVPAMLAFVSGYFFGGDILDPNKVKTTEQAAWRGGAVAFLIWSAFVVIITIYSYSLNTRQNIIGLFIWTFLMETCSIGWMTVGVGILVGIFLFKFRRERPAI